MKVFGAEPCNADDCYQSKVRGELTPNLHPPDTIADAVKTSIGPNTWPIIRDWVDDVLTVSEEEIKVTTPGSPPTGAASRQLPPSMLCPSTLTPPLSQGNKAPAHHRSCATPTLSPAAKGWRELRSPFPWERSRNHTEHAVPSRSSLRSLLG